MNPSARIPAALSGKVLLLGDEYRHDAPGGIAAVLRAYAGAFETVRFLPTWRSPRLRDKFCCDLLARPRFLLRLLTDRRIRIVHIHTAAEGSFRKHAWFVRTGIRLGRRVILHSHGSRLRTWYEHSPETGQARIRRTLRQADRVVALSASWRDWFISLGVPEEKVVILNNIVPHPQPVPTPADGRRHFLFLGEIGPRKGVFDLLEAFARQKRLQEGAFLHIGGNRNEERLRTAIREKGLETFVRFEGYVTGERKRQLLTQADVFVLPSHDEGLPVSILEAMSYGCAIVSTPVGGIPEVVRPGENGLLVPPGDPQRLSEALVSVLDEASLRRMGAASRERVKPYYPEAVLADLGDLYRSLL